MCLRDFDQRPRNPGTRGHAESASLQLQATLPPFPVLELCILKTRRVESKLGTILDYDRISRKLGRLDSSLLYRLDLASCPRPTASGNPRTLGQEQETKCWTLHAAFAIWA